MVYEVGEKHWYVHMLQDLEDKASFGRKMCVTNSTRLCIKDW